MRKTDVRKKRKVIMPMSSKKIFDHKAAGIYGKIQENQVPVRRWQYEPDRNDLKDVEECNVKCNNCGALVGSYKHKKGGPHRKQQWDVVYYTLSDQGEWYGCRGVNIQKNSFISFECTCGNDDRPNVKHIINKGFTYGNK